MMKTIVCFTPGFCKEVKSFDLRKKATKQWEWRCPGKRCINGGSCFGGSLEAWLPLVLPFILVSLNFATTETWSSFYFYPNFRLRKTPVLWWFKLLWPSINACMPSRKLACNPSTPRPPDAVCAPREILQCSRWLATFRVARFLPCGEALRERRLLPRSFRTRRWRSALFRQILRIETLGNASDFKGVAGCGVECVVTGVETILRKSNNELADEAVSFLCVVA